MAEYDDTKYEGNTIEMLAYQSAHIRKTEGDIKWARYLGMKVTSMYNIYPDGMSDEFDRRKYIFLMVFAPQVDYVSRRPDLAEAFRDSVQETVGKILSIQAQVAGPFGKFIMGEWTDRPYRNK